MADKMKTSKAVITTLFIGLAAFALRDPRLGNIWFFKALSTILLIVFIFFMLALMARVLVKVLPSTKTGVEKILDIIFGFVRAKEAFRGTLRRGRKR